MQINSKQKFIWGKKGGDLFWEKWENRDYLVEMGKQRLFGGKRGNKKYLKEKGTR